MGLVVEKGRSNFEERINAEFEKLRKWTSSDLGPKNLSEFIGAADVGVKPNILRIIDEARRSCPLLSDVHPDRIRILREIPEDHQSPWVKAILWFVDWFYPPISTRAESGEKTGE